MTREEFRYALLDDGWTETLPDVFKYEDDAIKMEEKCAFFFGGDGNYVGIPYEKLELRNGDFSIRS